MTPLRRCAASPLEGGTAPVARRSRFHGACWIGGPPPRRRAPVGGILVVKLVLCGGLPAVGRGRLRRGTQVHRVFSVQSVVRSVRSRHAATIARAQIAASSPKVSSNAASRSGLGLRSEEHTSELQS